MGNYHTRHCWIFPFAIPDTCPDGGLTSCGPHLQQLINKDQESSTPKDTGSVEVGSASTTSTLHNNKKRKDKYLVVETEVRRSCRLQQLNKGFKKNVCLNGDCMVCHALPPPIPSRVVKNLNSTFCKVTAKDNTEENIGNRWKKIKGPTITNENSKNAKESNRTKLSSTSFLTARWQEFCGTRCILPLTLLLRIRSICYLERGLLG